MKLLTLRERHRAAQGRLDEVNGNEVVADYGEPLPEYMALRHSVGLLDLSFRERICLTGGDRIRFLHGQVTQDVKGLSIGDGCYAALVTAKAKIQSDLNLYRLPEEILLDFEPGYLAAVTQRLEAYIIADDVQVVEVGSMYALLSLQGPLAGEVLAGLGWMGDPPDREMSFVSLRHPTLGEVYVMHRRRIGVPGFDLFVPNTQAEALAAELEPIVRRKGGRWCGWEALDMARIEAMIPRFGIDMDETNLVPETGIEERAVSYTKGCYIGQEIISRLRTRGQVTKTLRGLRLSGHLPRFPASGEKLFLDGKEAGYLTSVLASPSREANLALGYVRRGADSLGTRLGLTPDGDERDAVEVCAFPFKPEGLDAEPPNREP